MGELINLNPGAIALPLPVELGGTGSVTRNFVALSSDEAIGGTKTFTQPPIFPNGYQVGGDPFSPDNYVAGQNFQLVDGNFFQNYRVYPGGIVYFRCGAGLNPGWSTMFQAVDGSSGVVNFPARPATPGGGTFSDTSDIRLKKNIRSIKGALDKICSLSGCEFDWKFDEDDPEVRPRTMGFIAQNIEESFPNWVTKDNKGVKSMNLPFEFFALLVEAIKELKEQVRSQTKK